MGQKYDSSLFMMVSSSKKRPNAVTLGRLFDFQLLDMVELQLVNFKPSSEFKVSLFECFLCIFLGAVVSCWHEAVHRSPGLEF